MNERKKTVKRKKTMRNTFTALALAFALMLVGCGGTGGSDDASSEVSGDSSGDLQTVVIGSTVQTGEMQENVLLAQKLGYIDEELANVGATPKYAGFAQAGPAINEAFAAEEIDFAVYADLPAFTAKSNGVDIEVVAAVNTEMNFALFAAKGSGISSAADLAGKRVIVTPGTILYKYFVDLLEKNGIALEDVEIVNALSDATSVLAAGDADAMIITYSAAFMYQDIGKIVEDSTKDLEEASGYILAGRTAYMEEHPEITKALIRALKRSADYAAENPDKVYDLLATDSIPAKIQKQAYGYDDSFQYFQPALSKEYMKRAKSVYEFCKTHDLLGGELKFDSLFNDDYVNAVLSE